MAACLAGVRRPAVLVLNSVPAPRLLSLPLPCSALPRPCRLQQTGEADVRAVQDALSELDAAWAALELDLREKADQIQGLQTEKELQSGGEVRELQAEVDDISKRWVGEGLGRLMAGVVWVAAAACIAACVWQRCCDVAG